MNATDGPTNLDSTPTTRHYHYCDTSQPHTQTATPTLTPITRQQPYLCSFNSSDDRLRRALAAAYVLCLLHVTLSMLLSLSCRCNALKSCLCISLLLLLAYAHSSLLPLVGTV